MGSSLEDRGLFSCVMDGRVWFRIFISWYYTCFSPSTGLYRPPKAPVCHHPRNASSQIAETPQPQNPELPIGVNITLVSYPLSSQFSSNYSYGSLARSSSTLVTLSWYGWCLSVL